MRFSIHTLSLLASLPLAFACGSTNTASATEQSYNASVAMIEIEDADNRRHLEGWVWYPTHANYAAEKIGGNPVWEHFLAAKDAEPAKGQHPLLLISHGMYGNVFNQGWLAQRLSQRGYIVAAINHPGTTSRDRRPDESRRLWDRPRDLSRLLDDLLADSRLGDHIDNARIAAAGHSLGGLTVMRLAGATGDNARHREFCKATPVAISCSALQQLNIGHAEDTALLASSNRDERVRAVISLDLGGTQTLNTDSLAAIDVPTLVIGAPRGLQINQAIESDALAAKLPINKVERFSVEDTGHFDFLGICTEQGLAILRDEEPQDAVVCEQGRSSRMAKHAEFAAAIDAFLARHGLAPES